MRIRSVTIPLVGVMYIVALGCDPQAALRGLFQKQGLNLLRPVRSYVQNGGLVVVPRQGAPFYVDPLDTIPEGTTDKPLIDFSAVIAAEFKNQSASLKASTKALQALTSIPLSFAINSDQQVEVSQIHAAGTRLRLDAVKDLLRSKRTSDWITEELMQRSRTFVIYEVYRASQIVMRTRGSVALDIGLQVGEASGGNAAPGAKASQPSDTTKPSSSTSTQTGNSSQKAADTCATKLASADKAAAVNEDAPVAAVWARTAATELALCGDRAYPFAVRVAEVTRTAQGLLQLRPGNFRFPGNLGATEDEKVTAFVSGKAELTNLQKGRSSGR